MPGDIAPSAAPSASFASGHGWHLAQGIAFLAVALIAAAIADARQDRDHGGLQRRRRMSAVNQQRAVTACAVAGIGAAAVHFAVMPAHFKEASLYGAFFLVTATAQVGWSVLICARPTRRLLIAGAAANAAVVGLWLITRTVSIPLGPAAGTTESFGALDILASGFELAIVATSIALVTQAALPARQRLHTLATSKPLLLGAVGAAALVSLIAAAAPPS